MDWSGDPWVFFLSCGLNELPVSLHMTRCDFYCGSLEEIDELWKLCRFKRWNLIPLFRKGKLWMSMHRRHSGMVVGDMSFYRKFKHDCMDDCTLDEEYTQTLLSVLDPTVSNPPHLSFSLLPCLLLWGRGLELGWGQDPEQDRGREQDFHICRYKNYGFAFFAF